MYRFWKNECERVGDKVDKIFYNTPKNSIQYVKDNATLTVVFDDKNKTEKFYGRENDVITGDLGEHFFTVFENGTRTCIRNSSVFLNLPTVLGDIAEDYRNDMSRYQERKNLKIDYDEPQKEQKKQKKHFFGIDR